MMAGLVTIVIPTIDRPTLARAIDSARAQTVPCELIVEHDPDRTGCGPTLNRAIAKVQTPWFMGLADDDVLLPTAAASVAAALGGWTTVGQPAADMIIFRMQYPDGRVLPVVETVDELACGNVGSSFALRTAVARQIGYMDSPCTPETAEDWSMIHAVRERGHNIIIVPQVQVLLTPP